MELERLLTVARHARIALLALCDDVVELLLSSCRTVCATGIAAIECHLDSPIII
jgi:hypothetical protein